MDTGHFARTSKDECNEMVLAETVLKEELKEGAVKWDPEIKSNSVSAIDEAEKSEQAHSEHSNIFQFMRSNSHWS